jgi:hypothetical protein
LQTHLLIRGSFSKGFRKPNFITQVTRLFWENNFGTTGLPVRSSPGTQPHSVPENNSRHEKHPIPSTSFCDHTVTRPIPWTRLFE